MERASLLGGDRRVRMLATRFIPLYFVALCVTVFFFFSPNHSAQNGVVVLEEKKAFTTTTKLPQAFSWQKQAEKEGIPVVDCSTTVSDDPRFYGDVGAKYTVYCPERCMSFGNQEAYGTEIFLDDSVICKAAAARGKLGNCNPGKVTFQIVEPLPKYPAGKDMPTSVGIPKFVESSSGDEGASSTNGTCQQIPVETFPFTWEQWDLADPKSAKGQEKIKDIMTRKNLGCSTLTGDAQQKCAEQKAIEKYRWHCTDDKQATLPSSELAKINPQAKEANYVGECYGKRAFKILDGGQVRMSLKMTGYGEAAPTCNAELAKAASAITVELWVKDDKLDDGAYISSIATGDKGDAGFALGVNNKQWSWSLAGSSSIDSPVSRLARVTSPDYVTDVFKGKWTHLAGTYDGKTMRLFINGKAIGCGTSQEGKIALSDAAHLVVGSLKDFGAAATSKAASGEIDEVRIWSKAFSESEFTTDHMSMTIGDGKSALPADLVVYYRFDGQDDKTASGCAETGKACELTFHGVSLAKSTSPVQATADTKVCAPAS